MRFVDTDVLLYAISKDDAERVKATKANEILRAHNLALSVQVLQSSTFRRHARPGPTQSALRKRTAWSKRSRGLPSVGWGSRPCAAMATSQRFQISYWDAAIVEAARMLGCSTVPSEDLGDGQD